MSQMRRKTCLIASVDRNDCRTIHAAEKNPFALHIAIILTGHAYLPEAWAYRDHLCAAGHAARLVDSPEDAEGADIAIAFSLGHQRRLKQLRIPAIHEYHSLSAGRLRLAKDMAKRFAAPTPRARIFTEEHIRRSLGFAEDVPTLLRPVGVDAAIFGCAAQATPTHDIVFCGSIERRGVVEAMERLARNSWRVIAFGSVPPQIDRPRLSALGIDFAGPIARADVPAALGRARFGLNVTPDVVPFNRQTSVKTLEYAAAGLGIIANRYGWVDQFAADHGVPLLWLDDVLDGGRDAVAQLPVPVYDPQRLAHLEWNALLELAGFAAFVSAMAQRTS